MGRSLARKLVESHLASACRRFGLWFSKAGNGISHPTHMQPLSAMDRHAVARPSSPGDVVPVGVNPSSRQIFADLTGMGATFDLIASGTRIHQAGFPVTFPAVPAPICRPGPR